MSVLFRQLIIDISTSSSAKNNIYKILLTTSGHEVFSDKVIFTGTDTRLLPYAKKLISGEQIRVTIEGVPSPNGISTLSISYFDLPWTE